MRAQNNQKIEEYYFERFKSCFPLPNGTIEYSDKPDVILTTPDKTIGIEIANLYIKDGKDKNSMQRQQPLRELAIKEAQNIYLKTGGENIEFSFGFNPDNPITDHKELAQKLADLARQAEKYDSGSLSQDLFVDIPELSFAYINSNEYEDAKWRLTQVYSAPSINSQRLIEIIKEKEEKSKRYKLCNFYWLLLVIDFINPAQDQHIVNYNNFGKIQSDIFEKIFVYKTGYDEIFHVSQDRFLQP